jgi:hypothetical protein
MSETIKVEMTIEQAEAVVNAINCLHYAAEGDEENVRYAYLLEVAECAQVIADQLRPQVDGAYKRNPRFQDMLHAFKMYRKYGPGEPMSP